MPDLPLTIDASADDECLSSSERESLAALARDPALITGVFEACDQWCQYCRVRDRCLAFRSTNAAQIGGVFDTVASTAGQTADGAAFLKVLANAEGRLAPPEIEAALSGDRERLQQVFCLDDPLERIGRRYMMLATAYLESRPDFPPELVWRADGPTALEVLAWHHVLVPARVFRAILTDAEARQGVRGRRVDTLRAAKVALTGIDRSITALEELSSTDDDPRLELMCGVLHRLREGVESRFGSARGYIRPGLDSEPARETALHRHLRRLRRLLHWPDGRPAIAAASGDLRGSARRAGSSRG